MARKQYTFAYTPNVACNNEALAIACEANGDHLKANDYWHRAMKIEVLKKEGSNPKRVTYLHRRALNAYHHYEINKAVEELL